MGRMKLWYLPIFALASFLAVVALAPRTSWIPKTQLDILRGDYEYQPLGMFSPDFDWPYVGPRQSLIGPYRDSQNPQDQLLSVVVWEDKPRTDGPDEWSRRIKAGFDACKQLKAAAAWATLVRYGSQTAGNLRSHELTTGQRTSAELLIQACDAGQKLEPGNSYFATLKAGFLSKLGRLGESRDVYLAAAKLPDYQDHIDYEVETSYARMQQTRGSRGMGPYTTLHSRVLLPQLNTVRALARQYAHSNDPAMRRAVMDSADKLMRQGSTFMDVAVARSMFYADLQPPSSDTTLTPKLEDDEVKSLATKLGALTGEPDRTDKMAREMLRLKPLVNDQVFSDSIDEKMHVLLNMEPVWSAFSLGITLFSIAALALAALRSGIRRDVPAAPFVVWGMAFALSHASPGVHELVPYFGGAMLLGPLTLFDRTRKAAMVSGYVVAVIALGCSLGSAALALPAVSFIAAMQLFRFRQSLPSWTFGLIAVVAATIASYWPIAIALRHGFLDIAIFGGLSALCSLFIVPARKFDWLPALGFACTLAGAYAVVDTFRQVSNDRELEAVQQSYRSQVSDLRKQAGID